MFQNLQTDSPNTRKLTRGKSASKKAQKPQATSETPSEKKKDDSDTVTPDSSLALFPERAEQDILDTLPPERWAALEAAARARVIAENVDPVRKLAKVGKAWTSVKPMMRKLIAEQEGGGGGRL